MSQTLRFKKNNNIFVQLLFNLFERAIGKKLLQYFNTVLLKVQKICELYILARNTKSAHMIYFHRPQEIMWRTESGPLALSLTPVNLTLQTPFNIFLCLYLCQISSKCFLFFSAFMQALNTPWDSE